MPETILTSLAYQHMVQELNHMPKEEINIQLKDMGSTLLYEDIKERLFHTYNELAIADHIFDTSQIQEKKYPKDFIDEAVLEIAMRENYGFTHYGIISSQIRDIMKKNILNSEKIECCCKSYRKLCQCAQKFNINAMETMQYQVNDGIDLYMYLMDLLDLMMQEARVDKQMYRKIIDLCEKLLKTFSNSHPFLRASIQYEQAAAYIGIKSKKGEQMFQQLLKTHSDPSDVVLHYALAYLDNQEKRARSILLKYKNLWDEKSDAYDVIQHILEETSH